MNELIAGVRSDLAIQIFGEDIAVLEKTANDVVDAVSKYLELGASGHNRYPVFP